MAKITPQYKYIDCERFNELCIEITDLQKNEFVNGQLSSQILYRYPEISLPNDLAFRTPFIEIVNFAIPLLGEYIKTEEQRSFIKVPLDPKQTEALPFIKLFENLDNYMLSHKHIIFEKYNESEYEYIPCIKYPQQKQESNEPQENTDEFVANNTNKKKKQYEQYKYVKLKIPRNFNTKKIMTHIYVRNSMNEQPRKIEPKSMDDLGNYLTLGSKIRMIVSATKLWANEYKNDPKDQYKKFGIIMKIMNMEILLSQKETKVDTFSDYAF